MLALPLPLLLGALLAAPATTAPTPPKAAPADVVVPNENLVTDGIPPIPTAIAAAVGGYSDVRMASFQSWHPRKHELLISTRFADTPQIHRVSAPGGARTQLTFFTDRVGGASYPRRGDGSFFVFAKDTGGGEFYQLYRFDAATGAVTLLTDGKSRNGAGPWAHDGVRMAYTSTRRNGKDTDLYVIDARDPKTDRKIIDLEGGGWQPLDWSPDDKTLLVAEMLSINESHLWLVDVGAGTKREVSPRDAEPVSWDGGRFARDGKSIITTSDRGAEFMRLGRLDLANRTFTPFPGAPAWDVDAFDVSQDGKTLAFITNEDGVGKLHLGDARTGKEKASPRIALPVGIVSRPSFHPDGKILAVEIAGARSPADVYGIDLRSGKVERWTSSETGGLNPESFSKPELVKWKTFDGREIAGFLTKPPARFSGRRPVVVLIHGGPEAQARPGFLGRNNYLLNELGVALIQPNVRGSTGYGKTFTKLDNGLSRLDAVKDIGALLDWIKTRPDLDADRIMIAGGSYGGYMTLAVSVAYADRIRCAMDVVGISNFVTFLEKTEAYRRDLRRVEYGDERDPKMRAFQMQIAPVKNADKIRKPLFIVQGKNDPRVPQNEAEQMVATLKKQKTPVWYLLAKDEGHGFAKKKNADFHFYALVAFMQEHLLK